VSKLGTQGYELKGGYGVDRATRGARRSRNGVQIAPVDERLVST
jgi:hypothetical protein